MSRGCNVEVRSTVEADQEVTQPPEESSSLQGADHSALIFRPHALSPLFTQDQLRLCPPHQCHEPQPSGPLRHEPADGPWPPSAEWWEMRQTHTHSTDLRFKVLVLFCIKSSEAPKWPIWPLCYYFSLFASVILNAASFVWHIVSYKQHHNVC